MYPSSHIEVWARPGKTLPTFMRLPRRDENFPAGGTDSTPAVGWGKSGGILPGRPESPARGVAEEAPRHLGVAFSCNAPASLGIAGCKRSAEGLCTAGAFERFRFPAELAAGEGARYFCTST